MFWTLILIGGTCAVVMVIAWRVRRHQRDIDDYQEHEYREPPFLPPFGGS